MFVNFEKSISVKSNNFFGKGNDKYDEFISHSSLFLKMLLSICSFEGNFIFLQLAFRKNIID